MHALPELQPLQTHLLLESWGDRKWGEGKVQASGRGQKPLPDYPGVKCCNGGGPSVSLDPDWSRGISWNLRQLASPRRILGGEEHEAGCGSASRAQGPAAAALKQQR